MCNSAKFHSDKYHTDKCYSAKCHFDKSPSAKYNFVYFTLLILIILLMNHYASCASQLLEHKINCSNPREKNSFRTFRTFFGQI